MKPETRRTTQSSRRLKRGESIGIPGSPLIERTHTPEGRAKALAVLQSFDDGDPEEQRQTWEIVKAALDRDRLSNRKFYP